MIIDIHTHLGDMTSSSAALYWKDQHRVPDEVVEAYLQAMEFVDRCVMVGFPYPSHNISCNECIRQFAQEHGDKFIPFYCLNPGASTAMSDLERAVQEWGAKGIKLSPIYSKFRPDDEQYFPFYARLEELRLPTIWHQGSSFIAPDGPLEWAMPWRLDKIARTFPGLKILVAHLGFPWIREAVALVRKRPNVYTDVSGLDTRTWVLYNALVDAAQYEAVDKVLFGSDFPPCTPARMRDALFQASSIAEGTNLPSLPRRVIDGILSRNSLEILGIE